MLILGFVLFVMGAAAAIYGNYLNNDLEQQLESIFNDGQANSGDLAIYIGIAIAIIGILCIIIDVCKGRNGQASVIYPTHDDAVKWCPICGARIGREDGFCSICGSKQLQRAEVVACNSCGVPLDADARFCAKCGASATAEGKEDVL